MVTTERCRVYKGATELKLSSGKITKSDDKAVDQAKVDIQPNSNVTRFSTIDFTRVDGSTVEFTGKAVNIEEAQPWTLDVYSNGYELVTTPVQQVYAAGTAIEDIVQDIVDNHTNTLTYASTQTSGISLSEDYIADAHAMEIIQEMMDVLGWPLRIDSSDNVYFEPKNFVDNGATFTNGSNCHIEEWTEDGREMINRVKVIGQNLTYDAPTETFSGTGAEQTITLQHKPVGTVVVKVSGTVQEQTSPNAVYTVNPEDKEIVGTFASGSNNVTVDYSYSIPIVVDYQDDTLISDVGYELFKEVQAPWLNSFADARRYAKNIVNSFTGNGLISAKIMIAGMDWSRSVNELITVSDTVGGRSKSYLLAVRMIELDIPNNVTILHVGTRDFLMQDWQAEAQDRLKKLERRFKDEEATAFSRYFTHDLNVDLSLTNVWEYASPNNTFVLGHQTLGRLRADRTFEADCSDNGHHGTWNGTSIDGSQYASDGFRLYAGSFNGSDNFVDVADHADLDLSGDCTICISIRVGSLPGAETYVLNKYDGTDGYAVRITASNTVEFVYWDTSSESSIASTTALTVDTWYHFVFVKSSTSLAVYVDGDTTADNTGSGGATIGTNSSAFEVGRYSTGYFTGDLDEVMVYTAALSTTLINLIYQKELLKENMVLYWSMDDPVLYDEANFSSRATVS